MFFLLHDTKGPVAEALQADVRRIDIDNVRQQESKSVSYHLTNVSDDELSLEAVHTSCGCTEWKLDKRQLKSGESAELSVTFSSGQVRSKIGSLINVFYKKRKTNEPGNLFLELVADVDPDYNVSPESLDFDKGNKPVQYITLTPNFFEDIRILDISCSRRYYQAEIVTSNSEESVVKVSFLKDEKLPGEKDGIVQLHTNSSRQPVYQLNLRCEL